VKARGVGRKSTRPDAEEKPVKAAKKARGTEEKARREAEEKARREADEKVSPSRLGSSEPHLEAGIMSALERTLEAVQLLQAEQARLKEEQARLKEQSEQSLLMSKQLEMAQARLEEQQSQLKSEQSQLKAEQSQLKSEQSRMQHLQDVQVRLEEERRARRQAYESALESARLLDAEKQARRQAEQRYEELEAKMHFMRSITNTNPELVFEVTAMRRMSPPAGLRRGFEEAAARMEARADLAPPEKMRRMVFHTAPADALARIEQEGMRPSKCRVCLEPSGVWPEHDAGFFGNHALGVYVSRHADYTFYYQRQRKVQPGDTVRETPCPPLPSRLPQIQGVSIPNRSALSQPE